MSYQVKQPQASGSQAEVLSPSQSPPPGTKVGRWYRGLEDGAEWGGGNTPVGEGIQATADCKEA